MGAIAWTDFTWEAFATLVTGALAVTAAVVIGFRQTAIQKRQVALQEAELRNDLFERRYSVFDRAEQFLREIIQKADDPERATIHDFQVALGEARFLFHPDVEAGLREIWNRWTEFHVLKSVMRQTFQVEGHYGDGNPAREAELLIWISDRLISLPELFQELRLSVMLERPV